MLTHRILVVDDDPGMVRLLKGYLEMAGYQVLTAYTGETALHIIRRERPDLILLDLMLPDRDGWDITRIVRKDPNLAQIPIIMLTARVTDADKINGLELGADDYVTKPYNPREIVARVRARLRILDGLAQAVQIRILQVGDLVMDLSLHLVTLCGEEIYLTVTEYNLLQVLMEQAGFVVTRAQLIHQALGSDFLGLERTLDSHMRNLRKKIEPAGKTTKYIKTIYGVGYRLEAEEVK